MTIIRPLRLSDRVRLTEWGMAAKFDVASFSAHVQKELLEKDDETCDELSGPGGTLGVPLEALNYLECNGYLERVPDARPSRRSFLSLFAAGTVGALVAPQGIVSGADHLPPTLYFAGHSHPSTIMFEAMKVFTMSNPIGPPSPFKTMFLEVGAKKGDVVTMRHPPMFRPADAPGSR